MFVDFVVVVVVVLLGHVFLSKLCNCFNFNWRYVQINNIADNADRVNGTNDKVAPKSRYNKKHAEQDVTNI